MPPQDSKSPLTSQQQNILDAIVFFLKKGELPTVREVGALVGLRSPATVLKHLQALERGGWISINGKSRGIRLLRPELLQSSGLPLPKLVRGFGTAGKLQDGVFSTTASIPLVGAIAAGRPFESYSEGFGRLPDGVDEDGLYGTRAGTATQQRNTSPGAQSANAPGIAIDPRMFVESGEVFALQIEGDSMVNAGILDGDYVIIRRQNTVEDGEIAAVIINGEGTLKRWRVRTLPGGASHAEAKHTVSLLPANDRFDPIEITEDDAKDVLVLGKYVGLVRGSLRFL